MENTQYKNHAERLKEMRVGEAIHYTYQQINLNPKDSTKLVEILTSHFKDVCPNADQVVDGYQASVIRLGRIVSDHEPEIEMIVKKEEDNLPSLVEAQEVFETMKNEIQRYELAISALDEYSTEKFGKTPRQMHEEKIQQSIENLLK